MSSGFKPHLTNGHPKSKCSNCSTICLITFLFGFFFSNSTNLLHCCLVYSSHPNTNSNDDIFGVDGRIQTPVSSGVLCSGGCRSHTTMQRGYLGLSLLPSSFLSEHYWALPWTQPPNYIDIFGATPLLSIFCYTLFFRPLILLIYNLL